MLITNSRYFFQKKKKKKLKWTQHANSINGSNLNLKVGRRSEVRTDRVNA